MEPDNNFESNKEGKSEDKKIENTHELEEEKLTLLQVQKARQQ